MKKSVKILLIIGGSLLLLGIILCTGAILSVHGDFGALATVQYTEKSYDTTTEITSVVLDTENAKVVLERSEDEHIHIRYDESEKEPYTVTEEDGVLTIVKESQSSWFNFGISFTSPEVSISLPEIEYSLISLTTTNSKVISSIPLQATEFTCENSNASITLENLQSETLTIATSNATIAVSGSDCGNTNISTTNAEITVAGSSCDSLFVSSENAKIVVDGSDCGSTKIMTTNASITLSGTATDALTIGNENGAIELDGCTVSGVADISTVNGNITASNTALLQGGTVTDTNGKIVLSLIGNRNDYLISTESTNGSVNIGENSAGGNILLQLSNANCSISAEFEE